MSIINYCEDETDEKYKILTIENEDKTPALKIKIPLDMLINAGEYFTVMLNPDHNFRELSQQNIVVTKKSVGDVESDNYWALYFNLIPSEGTKEDCPKDEPFEITLHKGLSDIIRTYTNDERYGISLISRFFRNHMITNIIHDVQSTDMSDQSMDKYLTNWIYYYRNFLEFYPEKMDRLVEHFNTRLESIKNDMVFGAPTSYNKELLICMQDMKNYLMNGDENDLVKYLYFYEVVWEQMQEHILSNLSNTKDFELLINPFTYGLHHHVLHPDPKSTETVAIIPSTETFQPGQKMTVSEEELGPKFRLLTCGLLDDINWENMCLAGGSVNKLLNPKIDTFGPQVDLDLFVIGDEDTQRKKIEYLITYFTSKYGENLYMGYKRSVINLWVSPIPRMIQIIAAKSQSIFESLSRFDLSNSQMAYDGTTFQLTPLAIKCILTGISQQVNKSYIPNLYRIFKAHSLGYAIQASKEVVNSYKKLQNGEIEPHIMEPLYKMKERSAYNYYNPSPDISIDKNKWELCKHYRVKNIYKGCEIKVSNLLENIKVASDFRRSYTGENINSTKTFLQLSRINLEDINIGRFIRNQRDGMKSQIRYHECEFKISLVNMRALFINNISEMYGRHQPAPDFPRYTLLLAAPSDENLDYLENIDKHLCHKILEALTSQVSDKGNRRFRMMSESNYSGLIKNTTDKEGNPKYKNMPIKIDPRQTEIKMGQQKMRLEEFAVYPILHSRVNLKIRVDSCWASSNKFGIRCVAEKIQIVPSEDSLKEILLTNFNPHPHPQSDKDLLDDDQ